MSDVCVCVVRFKVLSRSESSFEETIWLSPSWSAMFARSLLVVWIGAWMWVRGVGCSGSDVDGGGTALVASGMNSSASLFGGAGATAFWPDN